MSSRRKHRVPVAGPRWTKLHCRRPALFGVGPFRELGRSASRATCSNRSPLAMSTSGHSRWQHDCRDDRSPNGESASPSNSPRPPSTTQRDRRTGSNPSMTRRHRLRSSDHERLNHRRRTPPVRPVRHQRARDGSDCCSCGDGRCRYRVERCPVRRRRQPRQRPCRRPRQ